MNSIDDDFLGKSYWYCDSCDRQLQHGEYRYNCTVCEDFDFCEECLAKVRPPHGHLLRRELAFGPPPVEPHSIRHMSLGIQSAFQMFADRFCFGVRDVDENDPLKYKDSYSWLTFKTVGIRVENFGNGLRSLLEPRSYLGICANNRPEWLITDFACILQRFISVPIYCSFNESETAFVINNTQISVVVCDKQMLPKLLRLSSSCPSLRHLVCMDSISDRVNRSSPVSIHSMVELEKQGSTTNFEQLLLQPDDCMTILYTSGSSGFPKGAIISEKVYRSTFPRWHSSSSVDRVGFAYRPLAWASPRDAAMSTFLCGGRTAFSTGDLNRLMEELILVAPTEFSAAPSFWNKVYAEYKTALASIDDSEPIATRTEKEKKILKEFSKLIPPRCRYITVGGAKISPVVFEFIQRCYKQCFVNESYGVTECGGVVYNNEIEKSIEYRIESVPEMGYSIDDKPFARGEMVVRTTQMFSGYINNPEETRSALTDDGFYRTGDIVELRPNFQKEMNIFVIDRKKSFFKLAQGQFVSPEVLQGIYIRSSFVEQIYIHGDILANSVSAVIIPNRDFARTFLAKHQIEDFDEENPHPKLCNAILKDLRSIGENESLRPHEIPSHIVVDFRPFTVENGLLTASSKPCRFKIAAYYADRLKKSSTIEERLKSIFGKTINEEFFINVGGDSLTAVRLSRMIENDLGISLPFHILFESKMNLQRLTNLIEDPSQISSTSKSIQVQLEKDSQMEMDFFQINGYKNLLDGPTTVFITGTTGFVGAFLLVKLLRKFPLKSKFICLVRSKSSKDPFQSIRDNLMFYQLWNDEYRKRILPLEGDLAKPFFGLEKTRYESLAQQIDLIFHCGATVNFILSYNQLYGSNVLGTREIIRLATYTTIAVPVQYISSISVVSSGIDNEVSIDEIPSDGLTSGYAQSKWVAEKLIARASRLGLRVNIYRLGSIGPSTINGACNPNDLHTLLIGALRKTRCYPRKAIDSDFVILPVDFTVKTIVHLTQDKSNSYGKTFHVVRSRSKIFFEDIVEAMDQCGIRLKPVSDDQWKIQLEKLGEENQRFESAGEFLVRSPFEKTSTINSEKFSQAISSFKTPTLDKKFTRKWIDFVIEFL